MHNISIFMSRGVLQPVTVAIAFLLNALLNSKLLERRALVARWGYVRQRALPPAWCELSRAIGMSPQVTQPVCSLHLQLRAPTSQTRSICREWLTAYRLKTGIEHALTFPQKSMLFLFSGCTRTGDSTQSRYLIDNIDSPYDQ